MSFVKPLNVRHRWCRNGFPSYFIGKVRICHVHGISVSARRVTILTFEALPVPAAYHYVLNLWIIFGKLLLRWTFRQLKVERKVLTCCKACDGTWQFWRRARVFFFFFVASKLSLRLLLNELLTRTLFCFICAFNCIKSWHWFIFIFYSVTTSLLEGAPDSSKVKGLYKIHYEKNFHETSRRVFLMS